jgi:Short-chain dehydrogenases of various substrate specificities
MTKTALITGATGGLGNEFVKLFAAKNNNLVLVGRNSEKLLSLEVETKSKYSVEVETITADFSDPEAAEKIYEQVKKQI